jgi:16S rRNA (uracil1498-N3)-methyltransferase
MHRILLDTPITPGQTLRIEGEEARHAVRVKRLQPGEPLELLDGAGHIAAATVAGSEKSRTGEWILLADVLTVETRPRPHPQVHVFAPAPKGDRLEDMIDALSQVGAASWSPLETIRTIREPREARLDRLQRIAREAAKQCGRAWALGIGPARRLPDLLAESPAATATIMADAAGPHYTASVLPAGIPEIRLLLGPEGDWDPRELTLARDRNIPTASFGPHIMRIAQAAATATAIILHLARSSQTAHPAPG